MPKHRALAIPIRKLDYSESSQILTLLTRERGRLDVIAKGARRPNTKTFHPFDLLGVYDVVYFEKHEQANSGREALRTVAEAKLVGHYPALRGDLKKYYAAMAVVELAREAAAPEDPAPALFDAVVAAVAEIAETPRPARAVARFKARALSHLGQRLTLDACAACGRKLTKVPAELHVSFKEGGLVCAQCRATHKTHTRISAAAHTLLQRLFAPVHPAAAFDGIPDAAERESAACLDGYLRYVFDKEFLSGF